MITCDQCQLLSINGMACHELDCPNSRARWIDGEWVRVRTCFECGCKVRADETCCTQDDAA